MNDNGARGYKVIACSASSGEETVGVKEGKGEGERNLLLNQLLPCLLSSELVWLQILWGLWRAIGSLFFPLKKAWGSMFSLPSSLVRFLRLGMRLLASALPGFLLIRLAVNCELE